MFMFDSILLFIVYKSFCIQCTLYILISKMNYRQGEKVKFDITGTIDRWEQVKFDITGTRDRGEQVKFDITGKIDRGRRSNSTSRVL